MTQFRTIIAALGLLLAFAAPGLAEEFTDAQQEGLAARIESFDAAMKANDMTEIMGVVPPAVLDKIAAKFNITKMPSSSRRPTARRTR
jgi:hypothetical protein